MARDACGWHTLAAAAAAAPAAAASCSRAHHPSLLPSRCLPWFSCVLQVRAETLKFKEDGVFAVVKDVFLPWYNAYRCGHEGLWAGQRQW